MNSSASDHATDWQLPTEEGGAENNRFDIIIKYI